MTSIDVGMKPFGQLNETIRSSAENVFTLYNVNGQRYIGCGLKGRTITINGVPGNALGAMDGYGLSPPERDQRTTQAQV